MRSSRLPRVLIFVALSLVLGLTLAFYVRNPHPPPGTMPEYSASGEGRDRFRQPFSSDSIWNTAVGSEAIYRPLHLKPPEVGYGVDTVYLVFRPDAPLRELVDRGYWWPWQDGSRVVGTPTGIRVRIPDDWIVEPPPSRELPNRVTAALQENGLAREFQYTVRPRAGSDISMFEKPRPAVDLAGTGLTPSGTVGGHGGSGLNGIGGTLRRGELDPAHGPIRHALAVTINTRRWAVANGGGIVNGYRWPATTADGFHSQRGFATGYGTIPTDDRGPRSGLGMGSLLAIPADVDLDEVGFETPQGRSLAWTHQNYGAYVVDTSEDDGDHDVHLIAAEHGVVDEFPSLVTSPGTPFGRDMTRIFVRLALIENNAPHSIGGGGKPRQPPLPPLAR